MYKARYITFHEVTAPITEPVTKFGGNPVWLTEPEWPTDASKGEPMLFVGQAELDPELFGEVTGQLAYLFVPGTDPLRAGVAYPFDKNVVVIQPGPGSDRPSLPLTEGPSVCRVRKVKRGWWRSERVAVPSEFRAETTLREEPEIDWEEDDPLADLNFLEQSKIGGQPAWIQGEQWPYGQPTPLLLQLVWGTFPFHLELGDAGTLYAFLSPDGRDARIVWDCC